MISTCLSHISCIGIVIPFLTFTLSKMKQKINGGDDDYADDDDDGDYDDDVDDDDDYDGDDEDDDKQKEDDNGENDCDD